MKHYIGQTQDIEKRIKKHNQGYVTSTRNGKPWKLMFEQECETRSEAMKLESRIKGRGAFRFLKDQNHRDVAQSG